MENRRGIRAGGMRGGVGGEKMGEKALFVSPGQELSA